MEESSCRWLFAWFFPPNKLFKISLKTSKVVSLRILTIMNHRSGKSLQVFYHLNDSQRLQEKVDTRHTITLLRKKEFKNLIMGMETFSRMLSENLFDIEVRFKAPYWFFCFCNVGRICNSFLQRLEHVSPCQLTHLNNTLARYA